MKRGADAWHQLAEVSETIRDAADQLSDAATTLAAREAAAGRRALDDFVGATRSKLSDLEEMAERGIARLTGK